MTPDDVQRMFEDTEGGFRFARWHRPIAPVVFGVDDATLAVVKEALEAVVALAGHQMAETDPEMGANLMVFFLRDWGELLAVPELEGLVPELGELVPRLQAAGANQYRMFRFEENGAIRAGFVFLRMDEALSQAPADVLALAQAVRVILLWGDGAFAERAPVAVAGEGRAVVQPEIAQLIRAAYAPELPAASSEPALALRLFARISAARARATN